MSYIRISTDNYILFTYAINFTVFVIFTYLINIHYCRCRVCGNQCALIRKYNLHMCRQCFRERAEDIGFIKYN